MREREGKIACKKLVNDTRFVTRVVNGRKSSTVEVLFGHSIHENNWGKMSIPLTQLLSHSSHRVHCLGS